MSTVPRSFGHLDERRLSIGDPLPLNWQTTNTSLTPPTNPTQTNGTIKGLQDPS